MKVRSDCDPAWPGPADDDQTMTGAQEMGLVTMMAVQEIMKENGAEIRESMVHGIENDEPVAARIISQLLKN